MKKIIDFFDKTPVTKFISSVLIMAMAVIMTMNVILRYCFHFSFNWGDEILRYMCVYMAFLGTAAACIRYGHGTDCTVLLSDPDTVRMRCGTW